MPSNLKAGWWCGCPQNWPITMSDIIIAFPTIHQRSIHMFKPLYHMPNKVPAHIFRAYDIRGIVGEEWDEHLAYALGRAFATEVLHQRETSVLIGRDGRHSSCLLAQALIQGVLDTGCDLIDLGRLPTPLLYFATHECDIKSGLMVTGSHNPANYNGIKMQIAGEMLDPEAILSVTTTGTRSRLFSCFKAGTLHTAGDQNRLSRANHK